ncbi:MAG: glycine C-acetyltransferase [Planctomycetes bacterium]|nr:glycine C-acetyltransferase [Planctomycetota bacterium]
MDKPLRDRLATELAAIREAGTYKEERIIDSPQGPRIGVGGKEVLNFCANNYLGLSSHPDLVAAAHRALDQRGYGMSSVRFICGTQDRHRVLEQKIAAFFGMDDAILYSSCFDANGGLFEGILGEEDAVISDELNHASIIDGIRLCKAGRFRYKHADMTDLDAQLKAAASARIRLIATDGVFSMDGDVAPLPRICDLAEKYGAAVMVDDSHATGFVGKTGRGTPEHHGVMGRVDIVTSTMGKALGGALGGFTAARREIVDHLRQRSRPYLFSNSLPPPVIEASITAFELLARTTELRDRLETNTKYFREKIAAAGFQIKNGFTPIVPIMLGDAKLAGDVARDLLAEGIYVIGFSYPVVAKGQARIRVQISSGHTREHLDQAVDAFAKIGRKHGVLR